MLQEHFSNPQQLEFEGSNEFINHETRQHKRQLEDLVWNKDAKLTTIQIEPVYRYIAQDIQRRAAIYVKRGKQVPEKRCIDNGMTTGAIYDKNTKKLVRVPGEFHSRLVRGTHTIYCVAFSAAESDLLADEVFHHLMEFGPVIRRALNFMTFDEITMEDPAILDESAEHFVVPVVVNYAYSKSWRVDMEAPWLKSIAVDVRPK
jgi:hypothetical protein